jgi:hypothetical protein
MSLKQIGRFLPFFRNKSILWLKTLQVVDMLPFRMKKISPPTQEDRVHLILHLSVDDPKDTDAKVENPRPKDWWDKLSAVSGIISGIAIALLGFYLTGRVENALKERQMQIDSAKDMQQLVADVNTKSDSDASASALTLAAYGKYAIPAFFASLQNGPTQAVAAETGLTAMILTEPEAICRYSGVVIDNRTELYSVQARQTAVVLIGEANCKQEASKAETLLALLHSAKKESPVIPANGAQQPLNIGGLGPVTAEQIRTLAGKICKTLTLLKYKNTSADPESCAELSQ